MAKPKPIQWMFEDGCIRCTSHSVVRGGYPAATRLGRFKTIAQHFLIRRHHGKTPSGIVSRHTCDNSWCINPGHIISGTKGDNNRDRTQRGRNGDQRGEKHGEAKLCNADVLQIRELELPQRQIARMFGVSQRLIFKIKHRQGWTHI